MMFHAGGTAVDTAAFQTKVDLSTNALFGGASISNLPNSGSYSNEAFSGTDLFSYVPDADYSLTIVAKIKHSAGLGNSSFNAELKPVPEPASMLLLGLGLLGICLATRKK